VKFRTPLTACDLLFAASFFNTLKEIVILFPHIRNDSGAAMQRLSA
jgi:hypothetical protein